MINETVKPFVESLVSDSFGLTIEHIAEQVKNSSRFSVWLNSDVNQIIQVLQIVENNGVSPAFFASYEVTEGYNSQWGWLNHTSVNGTPQQDAESVSQWIVSASQNMNNNPSWIDVGNPVDFVPESVKQEGNTHFTSLASGTIGRVVIAGTAAATWEVYYPDGLKKEFNGVQDYGAPLTKMVQLIQQWGGNIEGGSGGSKPLFPTTQGLPITSPYGYRGDIGVPGASEYHWAIDIGGGTTNHPIYATQDGVVRENRWTDGGGWRIVLEHTGDPYWSKYIHLDVQSPIQVGTSVTKGQEIGTMGTTGISSGIHLDFAVSSDGTWGFGEDAQGTIDPEDYLEMTFGGGGGDDSSSLDVELTLLLVDAMAGWKW